MTKHAPPQASDEPSKEDRRPPEAIDPAHRWAVEAGLADLRAGRIATDAEIEEVFARFGRPPC